MWKIGGFVLMIVFASRHTNGHALLFEDDADLDLQVNDIWNDQQQTENDSPRTLLEMLCDQYDLTYQNKVIDCDQLQISSKPLKVDDQHILQKREAGEELEGSGEEEPPSVPVVDKGNETISPVKDESTKETAPENPKEETKSEPEVKAAEEKTDESSDVHKGQEQPNVAPKTTIPGVEPLQTTSASAEKVPEAEEAKPEKAKTQETEPKSKETKPEVPEAKLEEAKNQEAESKTKETTTQVPEAKPEEPKTDKIIPEVPKTDEAKPEAPQTDETKPEQPKTDDSESKKKEFKEAVEVPAVLGDKVELSEAGKGQESDAKKGRKISQEDLNNQQSGNALVDSNGNMIETDVKLGGMKPNESIKVSAAGEDPKTGAASESAGRKDNTLLIGLFVAVLVVGAAAFSYNFVKKRRSRSAATRSQLNGTHTTIDPEEGREMKPLMKTEERKNNVEFNDEK